MKSIIKFLFCAVILVLTGGINSHGVQADTSIRFGTFNLHHDDLQADPANFERLLRKWGGTFLAKADIVVVQELTGTKIDNNDNRYLKILSESSGLTHRYTAYDGDILQDPTFPNVGIISRYPLESNTQAKNFSNGFLNWTANLLKASVMIENQEIVFYGTRILPSSEDNKISAAKNILQFITERKSGTQIILGGDFNSNTSEPPYSILTGNSQLILNDAQLASPVEQQTGCDALDGRVDYIFFNDPAKLTGLECVPKFSDQNESDHPFVLATFVIKSLPPTPLPDPRKVCLNDCNIEEGICMQNAHGFGERKACIQEKKQCAAMCP